MAGTIGKLSFFGYFLKMTRAPNDALAQALRSCQNIALIYIEVVMKYLSLIAIVIILQLSWWFSQKDKALTQGQKNRLLNVVKEYMTQSVKAKEPEASEIEFSNLYTETVEEGKVLKAHFKFSYLQKLPDAPPNKVHRKGHFLVTSNDGMQWKAQIDQINDVQVEFIESFNIEGDPNALPAEPAPSADDSHKVDPTNHGQADENGNNEHHH
jgi:hypothetical protein